MLRKSLKHEFINSIRILGIVYGGSLLLSGVTGLLSPMSDTTLFGMLLTISVLGIVAVVVSTASVLFSRYNNSILGKEAYFTFTLPVKNYVHIVARVINAAIFVLMALIVGIVDIFFLVGFDITSFLFGYFGGEGVSIFMFVVLMILIWTFCSVMEIYAAMSLGTIFTKNRVGGTILSMFIFSVVGSIATSLLSLPFGNLLSELFDYIYGNGGSYSSRIWVLFAIMAALCAILSGIFYLITWYVSCKRLKVGDN